MLKLQSKPVPGALYWCNEYSNGEVNRVQRQYSDEPFRDMGPARFPDGYTVKDALLELTKTGELYSSNSPDFKLWVNDRIEDASEGQELTSKVNPVIYRIVREDSE